jgi:hypothetical protein
VVELASSHRPQPDSRRGLWQFFHLSKQYTLPVEGAVARYMKRAQMAHNEYLQHLAEIGIPAALLLFLLFGYLVYLVRKRAAGAWPEFGGFMKQHCSPPPVSAHTPWWIIAGRSRSQHRAW